MGLSSRWPPPWLHVVAQRAAAALLSASFLPTCRIPELSLTG
ncbi:Hypothetical protein CAP_5099 [Chondromyces apiculatus DSM 436]|uniref:Uncharacterized protein n=1 Tax=Chondromyces apiculatus DSM 436 TaxID=1192034 RepID=A0A017T4T6_9BACT|nr:Hypothetical protein CAP_5099 [Chondromyces apiculatus DSM 436]